MWYNVARDQAGPARQRLLSQVPALNDL
nr:hypothetical protein [Pseudomonas syringae]